jgi:hypothetical protein
MGNSELCIGLLPPGTACRLLLTAGCLLPTAFEGLSWQEPAPVPQPRTRCHTWQGKKNPSDFKKVKERSGNVYENKGSVFHSPRQSGNVTENKDTYEFKAGMLLKGKVVSVS